MSVPSTDAQNWLCPDLRAYWQLKRSPSRDCWVLQGIDVPQQHRFSETEGFALAHFSGQLTVPAVQQRCEQKWGDRIPPDFVLQLFQKLVSAGVLGPTSSSPPASSSPASSTPSALRLKDGVQWFQQRDGHWILGDPEGLRHLQVSPQDHRIISQIGRVPMAEIPPRCGCTPDDVKRLLNLLAQGQMLEGVEPPQPPRRKFTPMRLLYFKQPLFNPDRWLTRQMPYLRWLWSHSMMLLLGGFLSFSGVWAIAQQPELVLWGHTLLQTYGWNLLLPFGLLSMAVVSLHELAHAFTLKRFGGAVSEMGLLFMCLMPAAYTNSSDSYRLPRWQHVLVIGAGVLCQLVIAAIAFWVWFATANSASLHTGAFLLMVAALFTVALNLNPLARFDGYYLLAAVTGINNLKGRSFGLYKAWLSRQPSPERGRDRWILAAYAPFSFLYLLLIFGKLFLWLGNTILTHIPFLALFLGVIWLIYYCYPEGSNDGCISPSSPQRSV